MMAGEFLSMVWTDDVSGYGDSESWYGLVIFHQESLAAMVTLRSCAGDGSFYVVELVWNFQL